MLFRSLCSRPRHGRRNGATCVGQCLARHSALQAFSPNHSWQHVFRHRIFNALHPLPDYTNHVANCTVSLISVVRHMADVVYEKDELNCNGHLGKLQRRLQVIDFPVCVIWVDVDVALHQVVPTVVRGCLFGAPVGGDRPHRTLLPSGRSFMAGGCLKYTTSTTPLDATRSCKLVAQEYENSACRYLFRCCHVSWRCRCEALSSPSIVGATSTQATLPPSN